MKIKKQAFLREAFEKQQRLKNKSSRETSKDRSKLSRSISPEGNQEELCQRFKQQEAELNKIIIAQRKQEQEEIESEKKSFNKHQAILQEKYEQQEFLKNKKSRESSKDRSILSRSTS